MNAAEVSEGLHQLYLGWRRGGGDTSFSIARITAVVKTSAMPDALRGWIHWLRVERPSRLLVVEPSVVWRFSYLPVGCKVIAESDV